MVTGGRRTTFARSSQLFQKPMPQARTKLKATGDDQQQLIFLLLVV
jgi:hypothetical protein